MNNVYEVTASVVECYLFMRFCNRFLGFKNKNMVWLKSLVFFMILTLENTFLSQRDGWKHISSFVLVIVIAVYAFLFLSGKLYEKILVSLFPSIMILPINITLINAFCTITGAHVTEIIEPGGKFRLLILIFSKLAFFFLCEFVLHLRRHRQYSLSVFQWIIQLSCFIITFLIAYLLLNVLLENDSVPEFLMVSILIVILNALLYVLLDRMQHDGITREEYRISQISLAAQERLVSEAREQYMEMRTLRHDMRHYLMTMAELVTEGRMEEVKAYIEKIINEKVDQAAGGVDTGDVVIDAVINNRIAACLKNHIAMKCMVDSHIKGIDNIDMSVLLSNVLDNAIRGCEGTAAPEVELIIGTRKAFTYIIVKNSIAASVLARNPDLETDRADRSAHGFGIMSMRRIAEKYKGSVEFKEENNTFIVEIWLENTTGPHMIPRAIPRA